MTTASAIIVADSISQAGIRMTTFQLRYWRAIHSELMTHRVFSRNAGSSRARPSAKIIQQVKKEPWGPIHWGVNQPGMQAGDQLILAQRDAAERNWKEAAKQAAKHAEWLMRLKVHKQVVNRLLEPFTYIDVLVSSTDYTNWFALRDHPDAQPEIQELAQMMKKAYLDSEPKILEAGEWHLPYITPEEQEALGVETCIKVSVARCARVSYKTFDGQPSPLEADLKLYEKLLGSQPIHASPAEHQATPDTYNEYSNLHGNFRGWIQYRKTLPGEYYHDYPQDIGSGF